MRSPRRAVRQSGQKVQTDEVPAAPEGRKRRRKLFADKEGEEATEARDPRSEQLSVLLQRYASTPLARWAAAEFHHAPVDAAFFSPSEFADCLLAAGIIPPAKLTRLEWSVIRSRIGKPRRLSAAFLAEERQRLQHTRQNVRALAANRPPPFPDVDVVIPSDTPLMLSAGQRIVIRGKTITEGVVEAAGDGWYGVNIGGTIQRVPDTMVMALVRPKRHSQNQAAPTTMIRLQTGALIQHLAQTLSLLGSKARLISIIAGINEQVASNGIGCMTPLLQQRYASYVLQLNRLNGALVPNLIFLRESKEALSPPTPVPASPAAARAHAASLVEAALRQLAQEQTPQVQHTRPTQLGIDVQQLVTNCMCLLLTIKAASIHGLGREEVDAAASLLKPRTSANTAAFNELMSTVSAISQKLLP